MFYSMCGFDQSQNIFKLIWKLLWKDFEIKRNKKKEKKRELTCSRPGPVAEAQLLPSSQPSSRPDARALSPLGLACPPWFLPLGPGPRKRPISLPFPLFSLATGPCPFYRWQPGPDCQRLPLPFLSSSQPTGTLGRQRIPFWTGLIAWKIFPNPYKDSSPPRGFPLAPKPFNPSPSVGFHWI